MSTIHHTPIDTGSPANASIFNTRFGDLDAAIEEVDDRISEIIADSGTSSTEVVDARNGYTVLNDRVVDLTHRSNVLYVDAAFTTKTAAKRFATISLAMAQCTGGEIIDIAPGTYTENVGFTAAGVTLRGRGQPRYDSGTGRLVGGTIIRGRISTGTYVGLTIVDLGIDYVDGTTGLDCIGAGLPSGYVDRVYRNLTILGKGTADLAHGIYSIGDGAVIDNCRIYHCHHAIAVHGSRQNISNCWMYYCGGTSLVLKAKGGYNVLGCNVNNIQMIGDTASTAVRAGPLAIQAEDSVAVRDINIVNVAAKNCVNGVVHVINTDVTGVISDVSFDNIKSDGNLDLASVGDYRIKDGSNLTFDKCSSRNRSAGVGFKIEAGFTSSNVRVFRAVTDASGSGAFSGAFDIMEVNGLRGNTPTTLTIASGVITITSGRHTVETEAAAATDDLDTINGGIDGQMLILQTANGSRDVTIKNNTGNIDCGSDRALNGNRDTITLIYRLAVTRWQMVAFGDNI